MADFERRAGLWHAAVLCLIAGFVDAIGYFELGHVFTANMTGNTVLLGTSLVKGDWIALSYAATIAAFSLGVVTSTALKLAGAPLPAVLLLAAGLLALLAVTSPSALQVLCALSFIMGLQGGAIATFSGIRLPTVVVISTLVNLVDGLVRRSLGRATAAPPPAGHISHLAAAWLAYGAGGGAAALAKSNVGWPLLVPVGLYVVVALGLLRPRPI